MACLKKFYSEDFQKVNKSDGGQPNGVLYDKDKDALR